MEDWTLYANFVNIITNTLRELAKQMTQSSECIVPFINLPNCAFVSLVFCTNVSPLPPSVGLIQLDGEIQRIFNSSLLVKESMKGHVLKV